MSSDTTPEIERLLDSFAMSWRTTAPTSDDLRNADERLRSLSDWTALEESTRHETRVRLLHLHMEASGVALRDPEWWLAYRDSGWPTAILDEARARLATIDAPARTQAATPRTDHWVTIPERLGRYRVDGVLGVGGFGVVFRAYDEELDRAVAIKIPHEHRLVSESAVESYVREARIAASLDHPNLVPVHDIGWTPDRRPYVVSRLVEGHTLKRTIDAGPADWREAARIVAAIAEGLHHAHESGLVHRDVKPSNVLFDTSGRPWLTDFGLAAPESELRTPGERSGTPAYMSPEQTRAESLDGRTDTWSLGVVLYELLTGERPFRGDDLGRLLDEIVGLEPSPPRSSVGTIPRDVESLCLRCLSKRARDRPSCSDVAVELGELLNPSPALRTGNRTAVEVSGWCERAEDLPVEEVESQAWTGRTIGAALSETGPRIVAGLSGSGRTFALRLRRLWDERDDSDAVFVPARSDSRDALPEFADLRPAGERLLADPASSSRLWAAAIRASILSHLPEVGLPGGEPGTGPRTPSEWLLEWLSKRGIAREMERELDRRARAVDRPVIVYVDDTDRAVRRFGRPAWSGLQVGLVAGAREVARTNPSIRVHATIRSEVLPDLLAHDSSLRSDVVSLRLEPAEQRDFVDHLCQHDPHGARLRERLVVGLVRSHGGEPEDAFDFARRHTLGRARDWVRLSAALSHPSESSVRETLMREASRVAASIAEDQFDTGWPLLDALRNPERRSTFLAGVPTGPMSPDDVREATLRFNGIDPQHVTESRLYEQGLARPFTELYDVGLFGTVVEPEPPRFVYEADSWGTSGLPEAAEYVVHPALAAAIERGRDPNPDVLTTNGTSDHPSTTIDDRSSTGE